MIGVGYEGLSAEDVVSQLKSRGVEVLVDVRLTPSSRKPGLSKTALARALEAVGIEYRHDRRLGNPKDNRAAYADRDSAAGAAARSRYRDGLTHGDGARAVRELADLSRSASVALLCFEADQAHCHREQVLAAVASDSVAV